MAGGGSRKRSARSRAAPRKLSRGSHARASHLCKWPSPLLCARMGALFSLLGLAVCWPAPRCVRGVLALGTCVDPARAATGMVCRCLGAVALHGGGGRNRIAGVGRGSGADTDGTALRHFATSNYAACTTTACPPSQPLPFAANARSNRSGDEFSPPPTSTSIAPHDVTTWPRGALLTGRSVARQTRASGLNNETRIARLRKPVAWTPHPHRGCRIGEATHPGPPDDGPTARRRERALHALAQMQLLPPLSSPREGEEHGTGSETDAAITLSDTLSATTPFASPRGEVQAELSGAMAPTAPNEATPGFTPPRSPDLPPREPETSAEPLPWQDARPPSSMPGERNSWLFVPLLQEAAGNLTARATHAWRSCPQIGTRFNELVSLLRDT